MMNWLMRKRDETMPNEHVTAIISAGVLITCLILYQGNSVLTFLTSSNIEKRTEMTETSRKNEGDFKRPVPGETKPQPETVGKPVKDTTNFAGHTTKALPRTKLYRGCKGKVADVLILQNVLKSKGYYTGEKDGKFGPALGRAVKKFQADHNLKADGVVGSGTWKALEKN